MSEKIKTQIFGKKCTPGLIKWYKTARDTKLQAFQYKLIHRVIPCNKYLANIRIKPDATCSYCDSTDTLQHFFYGCPSVNTLWDTLSSWGWLTMWISISNSMQSWHYSVFQEQLIRHQSSTTWCCSQSSTFTDNVFSIKISWRYSKSCESSASE